jgi:hypothetical protein
MRLFSSKYAHKKLVAPAFYSPLILNKQSISILLDPQPSYLFFMTDYDGSDASLFHFCSGRGLFKSRPEHLAFLSQSTQTFRYYIKLDHCLFFRIFPRY